VERSDTHHPCYPGKLISIAALCQYEATTGTRKETTVKKFIYALAAAMFAATLAIPAHAADGDAVQGEVRKIDEAGGKIILKHGPIKSLGMDVGMTMAFRVKDPAMLKEVKVGDMVEFEAEKADTGYAVTKMQKSK
jgi:Cu(I)/Ag(I) efflux system periplasmic protein CusF